MATEEGIVCTGDPAMEPAPGTRPNLLNDLAIIKLALEDEAEARGESYVPASDEDPMAVFAFPVVLSSKEE